MIIKLSKPIKHGESEITELDLRQPTVYDVISDYEDDQLGYPFVVVSGKSGTSIKLMPNKVIGYAARLSGLPPSVVKQVSITDLSKLQTAVMGFFGDEAETPQT